VVCVGGGGDGVRISGRFGGTVVGVAGRVLDARGGRLGVARGGMGRASGRVCVHGGGLVPVVCRSGVLFLGGGLCGGGGLEFGVVGAPVVGGVRVRVWLGGGGRLLSWGVISRGGRGARRLWSGVRWGVCGLGSGGEGFHGV